MTRSTPVLAGFVFMLAALPALASSECGDLKACERKFCEISEQLDIAKEEGNDRKVRGLTRALVQAKSYCTEESLREDLLEDIQDAREDLAEYEADLQESEEDGDLDDIRKYQRKIEEEKNEIERLEEELSSLD